MLSSLSERVPAQDGEIYRSMVALRLPSARDIGDGRDWIVNSVGVIPIQALEKPSVVIANDRGRTFETIDFMLPVDGPFLDAAERFGLDPFLMLGSQIPASSAIRSVTRAFTKTEAAESENAKALIRYLQYLVASKEKTPVDITDAGVVIDLAGKFAGIGWGPVATGRYALGRRAGHDGKATILLDVPQGGPVELRLRINASVSDVNKAELRLTAGGVTLPVKLDIDGDELPTLSSFLTIARAGLLVLQIQHSGDSPLGFVDLLIRSTSETDSGPVIDVFQRPVVATTLVGFPQDLVELERVAGLIEIPQTDLLLWRFGRDPALYHIWSKHSAAKLLAHLRVCLVWRIVRPCEHRHGLIVLIVRSLKLFPDRSGRNWWDRYPF